ncbi:hypothetical protein BO94DRAFT_590387 [Aspergillus sclerotioniger CBS 115572]|uniref:HNH nuclease domain-containing protein n=1 Tax=Aspergillus sclerotioniger CBS 115572 TaxID=1450535 RepID=A0A317VCI5_9EURO|nr:hypothetical protein BO94DRAFT_590387 [Aspergillus sclerotioniger CBS 115572]PWY69600.1 hypothetical protein BO94DRAFT_590387 [Aspergillus sclerotioniger CBS 115572]
MANASPFSPSLLTEAPSDISGFGVSQVEMNRRLERYTTTSQADDTVEFLRIVFQQLPEDGTMNLAVDIYSCDTDETLRQLVRSFETGLLFPMKAFALEAAHIIPFALGAYRNSNERAQNCVIWANILRYFPSLRSRLGFISDEINRHENVMMLEAGIHREFGRFCLTLVPTSTENTYTVKTYQGFSTLYNIALPTNGRVVFISHDNRYQLPHPLLLQVHNAVAHILHMTGRGGKAEKLKREYDDSGLLAPEGGSDVESLLSLSTLGLLESAGDY